MILFFRFVFKMVADVTFVALVLLFVYFVMVLDTL